MNTHRGAKNLHKMLRAPADFPLKVGGATNSLKKAELPSLSDYIYPVLMDTDPEQLVDDEFKHKHDQLFCWRMLKLISSVDQTTFAAGKSATENGGHQSKPSDVFEGNVEEQARVLCKQFMKRQILDHLPVDNDEEDGEGDDQLEGEENEVSELHLNGHTENENDEFNGEKPFSLDDEMVTDVPVKPEAAPSAKAH